MTPEQAKQVKQWEAEISRLEDTREPINIKIGQLRQSILEAKSIFKRGDLIEWTFGKQTRRGYVTNIIEWCCGDPEWKARLIKKDGTETGIVAVHPWTNPKKIS